MGRLDWSLIDQPKESLRGRLGRYASHYPCSLEGTRTYLLDRISRAERSMQSYYNCSLEELRGFVADRKLAGVKAGEKSKYKLVACLEQDDDNRTFQRFLDLPADVRVRIYQFHLTIPEHYRSIERPPPIANTSRLVRREVLPLFYAPQTLEITFDITDGSFNQLTLQAFSCAPTAVVQSCEEFVFGVIYPERGWSLEWGVELAKRKRPVEVWHEKFGLFDQSFKDIAAKVTERLKQFANADGHDGRFKRLQKEDLGFFTELVEMLPKTVPTTT